jgi:hypothetical protein
MVDDLLALDTSSLIRGIQRAVRFRQSQLIRFVKHTRWANSLFGHDLQCAYRSELPSAKFSHHMFTQLTEIRSMLKQVHKETNYRRGRWMHKKIVRDFKEMSFVTIWNPVYPKSVQNVLYKWLGLHAYKTQQRHEITHQFSEKSQIYEYYVKWSLWRTFRTVHLTCACAGHPTSGPVLWTLVWPSN